MLRSFFVLRKSFSRLDFHPLRVLLPLSILVVILAACGGASPTANTSSSYNYGAPNGSQPAATPPGTSGGSGSPTLSNGTPTNTYLIRSLSVSLLVNNPLDAEQQITKDVLDADTQAQAAGEEINQQSDGSYVVALTFAVSAPNYDTVKAYLNTFAADHPDFKGKLTSEKETVQNVTSQYVDLQSRLTNLRTEQSRLLTFLSQAQSLSDMLTIQDKLTDVEGQIEQIEGQINDLSGQTAYSTVTINLSSSPVKATPPPAPPKAWNPGGVLGAALSVLLAVLQVLADVLIWVLVFTPVWLLALGVYYIWRRIKQRGLNAAIKVSAKTTSTGAP
ncbi:MAG TPA: DUF4349 domain-containing protein [Ktedonobacterales bacterium]|nr:DUF4349 domain-containing protein [Ktedonobacterales bacterium]